MLRFMCATLSIDMLDAERNAFLGTLLRECTSHSKWTGNNAIEPKEDEKTQQQRSNSCARPKCTLTGLWTWIELCWRYMRAINSWATIACLFFLLCWLSNILIWKGYVFGSGCHVNSRGQTRTHELDLKQLVHCCVCVCVVLLSACYVVSNAKTSNNRQDTLSISYLCMKRNYKTHQLYTTHSTRSQIVGQHEWTCKFQMHKHNKILQNNL